MLNSRILLTAAVMIGSAATTTAVAQVTPKPFQLVESSPLSGVTRTDSRATMTVDFSGDTMYASGGGQGQPWVPFGGVGGTSNASWQWGDPVFEDPTDPTSRVMQATLYYVVPSIDAGQTLSGYTVDDGPGTSGGAAIGQDFSDRIEIDTGEAKFVIAKNGGGILQEVWVGGNQILDLGPTSALYMVSGGTLYSSAMGTATAVLEANGPAYARVSISGVMTDAQGNILTDYELELSAYAGTSDLLGDFEVSPGYWTTADDLNVSQIYLIANIAGGANPVLSAATQARSVLSQASASEGMQLGTVTSQAPSPYQAMSLTDAVVPRGLVSVSRTPAAQWPMTVDASGGFVTLNIGFTDHFVAPNEYWREAAEFSLAVFDPVPTDLDTYGAEVIHEVTAEVTQ